MDPVIQTKHTELVFNAAADMKGERGTDWMGSVWRVLREEERGDWKVEYPSMLLPDMITGRMTG